VAGRKVTRSEGWWLTAPGHVLRCTAHLKMDGSQCRRESVPGTNVCNQHGALIPAVRASAARRIQMSVDDAVKRLHEMLDDSGVDARDKIKILHDLLDRGGLAATSKVLVGIVTEDPVEALFRNLLSSPDALMAPEAPQPNPEMLALNQAVLDGDDFAEIVEELPRLPARQTRNPATPPKHIREALAEML
jgi:hypothetical protein